VNSKSVDRLYQSPDIFNRAMNCCLELLFESWRRYLVKFVWQPYYRCAPATCRFQRGAEERPERREIVVFSQDKGTADVIRAYPFLRGSLYGINAVRIAESRSH
jgi:hypothetical protein